MNTDYQVEYKEFVDIIHSSTPVDGKTIGELIVRLAHYFSDALQEQAKAEYAYQRTLAQFEKSIDDAGKALSSTKAESAAKATVEYQTFLGTKAHVTSIDAMISATKAYLKGATNEFSHMGNT